MSEFGTFECSACARRVPKPEARQRRTYFAGKDPWLCSECHSAHLICKAARRRQNQTAWAGISFGIVLGAVLLTLFSKPPSVRDQVAASGSRTLNITTIKLGGQIGESPKDVLKTENRLIELGFLKGPADDAVWGSKSRSALQRFKAAEGLAADDIWDEKVSGLLFSPKAVHAPLAVAERSK